MDVDVNLKIEQALRITGSLGLKRNNRSCLRIFEHSNITEHLCTEPGVQMPSEILTFRLPCLFCDTDYHGEGGCHPPRQFFNLSRYVQV
jgi:hypothetical protein